RRCWPMRSLKTCGASAPKPSTPLKAIRRSRSRWSARGSISDSSRRIALEMWIRRKCKELIQTFGSGPSSRMAGRFPCPRLSGGPLTVGMGREACPDPVLIAAAIQKKRVVTPSGMVLDGSHDAIEAPPPCDALTNANEIDPALVDHMEFYLLNYFKPGTGQQTTSTQTGFSVFKSIGCASCHIQNLQINKDRRVADVETVYDPVNGIFNGLFATATALFHVV